MYITVRLLKGFAKPLLYKVPKNWEHNVFIGSIIQVPLKISVVPALVESLHNKKPADCLFSIREANSLEPFPKDKTYFDFIKKLSNYYQIDPLSIIKRTRQFFTKSKTVQQEIQKRDDQIKHKDILLTNEQLKIFNSLKPIAANPSFKPTLIHGITGSGKTEVYKKLIQLYIARKKTCIFLVPEVTLAVQFESLFKATLPPNLEIFGFHSATSPREKKLLWQALIISSPILIVGVHLPITLPIENLGLIIIDEEHEPGYQEKKHPKINSKEAAILRAHTNNIPIVLGSATPSITSLYNVKNRNWGFFQLKKRFTGSLPKIECVNLRESKNRKSFWISRKLYNAINDRLIKKEQTIIFINRRGVSFFVQCKECSFVFECPNCSVSLTLHYDNNLCCHYCEFKKELPADCPECKTEKTKYIKKGIGTQQTVTILEKLLPNARIERADLDTTINRKKWNAILEKFQKKEIDILVGTQTITKGYHFPHVTLVGIIWADLNLHFPVYNATETALQQIIQVAGRAGRQSEDSLVIVQTMADHKIFSYVNEIDYLKFAQQELLCRKKTSYPPYTRIVEIELKNVSEAIIDQEAYKMTCELLKKSRGKNISVLGPAIPPVSKIKNTHSRKIYIKSNSISAIANIFGTINQKTYKSKIFFTPQPTG
ncbi:primosomal protein N' [bacterium]|jgi:primosomal protein N' (replication factor Y) (superfamily II helicase)|nr:primosomal protein N' [bacterium]